MWDKRRENKVFVRILLVSLFLVAGLTILHLLFSERIITDLYSGQRADFLGMHLHPEEKSLADYVHEGNQKFVELVVIAFPLSLVCLFLLYKLFRFLFSKIGTADVSGVELSKPALKHDWLVAILIYTLLTCVYFFPCLGSISQSLIGPPEDNLQTYWGLSWGYDRVLHGDGSFAYVTDLFYPKGSSSYYHSWSFYNQIVSAFLRQFCNQVACYNLLIMLTFVLAGIGAFLLIRYLIGNPYLALLGGFLFAFNPSHFAHAQHHLNIASIHFVPFFVLFFIRAIREGGWANLILAALFFLLNTLCDWNYMIMALWFMVFSYIYLAIRRRSIWLPDMALKGGLILGGATVVLSPWLIPMVVLGLKNQATSTFGHNLFVGDLAGLIVPPTNHLTGGLDLVKATNGSYTGNLWEATVYLGIVAIVVFALACRQVLKRSAKYIVGALAFALMTVGQQPHFLGIVLPAALPQALVRFLPLLGNARSPARFIVYVCLFWSLLVSLAFGHLVANSKGHWKRALVGMIIPLLLLVDFFWVYRETTVVSAPKCYVIMERGGEHYGILDLPSGYGEVDHYMMYQSFHRLPIVQGWTSRRIGTSLIDSLETVDLDRQKMQLVEARVRYVVLHKQFLPRKSVDPKAYARTYRNIYDDDSSTVYEVY